MKQNIGEAMTAFIDTIDASKNVVMPIFKTPEDVIDYGTAIITPFLTNPERHREHIRTILDGIVMNAVWSATVESNPLLNAARFRFLDKLLSASLVYGQDRKMSPSLRRKQEYIQKLTKARDGLLASLSPGQLDVDILPATVRYTENERSTSNIVLFQTNVGLYPSPELEPQGLSVTLEVFDERVQFADAFPSSRLESTQSHTVGIIASSKFTYTEKENVKATATLGGSVAKVVSGIGTDRTTTQEQVAGVTEEITEQKFSRLVISSAVKQVARWKLLKAPNQILIGGNRFQVSSFVPPSVTDVELEARVEAELDYYGTYAVSVRRKVDLPDTTTNSFTSGNFGS